MSQGTPESAPIAPNYEVPDFNYQARLKRCSTDTSLTGVLKGKGIGMVVVDSAGQPLLTTVQMIEIEEVSVQAVRSFAIRALRTCTFEPALTDARPSTAWAGFKVSSSRTGLALVSRERLPTSPPVALKFDQPIPVDTTVVYLQDDSLMEELPRQVQCFEGTSRGSFNRSPERTPEEVFSSIHAGDGRAEVSYIVRANGSVDLESLSILTTDNWNLAESFLGRIANCQFAPGRIQGQAVSVKVVTRLSRYARRAM
jgi:hypothetical protein